jgi:hypothetical protein
MSVVQPANPRDVQVRNVSIKVWEGVHHLEDCKKRKRMVEENISKNYGIINNKKLIANYLST